MLSAVLAAQTTSYKAAQSLAVYQAFKAEVFARIKRLGPSDFKREMDRIWPPKPMSARAIRAQVISMAKAMGATVEYRKRGE